MPATLTATLDINERQLRVADTDARRALDIVTGQHVVPARARLRYGPGRIYEALARVLDAAIVRAERAGLDPAHLVVAGGDVKADEDIVRVRRKAHGKADWIHTPTSHVRITLQPAGLHATGQLRAVPFPAWQAAIGEPSGARILGCDAGLAATVREALFEVIDPDLGVNVVDLGFVRQIQAENRTAIITMTLTSAACPLTGVMEDQIRAELARLPGIDEFRIDWAWLPAWRPDDITDSGREQLRAIGFSI